MFESFSRGTGGRKEEEAGEWGGSRWAGGVWGKDRSLSSGDVSWGDAAVLRKGLMLGVLWQGGQIPHCFTATV